MESLCKLTGLEGMPEANRQAFTDPEIILQYSQNVSFHDLNARGGVLGNRLYNTALSFHPYGTLSCELAGAFSDLSGFNVESLSPEGQFDTNTISNMFKTIAGQASAQVSQHIRTMQNHDFADSQVGLLYNMLRYVCATEWYSDEVITHAWGQAGGIIYNDGHVEAKPRQVHASELPEASFANLGNAETMGITLHAIGNDVHGPLNATDAIDCTGLAADKVAMLVSFLRSGTLVTDCVCRTNHPSSSRAAVLLAFAWTLLLYLTSYKQGLTMMMLRDKR